MSDAHLRLDLVTDGFALWREGHQQEWDKCLAACAWQPVPCSSGWIDYQRAYLAERDASTEDVSLLLVDGEEPAGLWPVARRTSPDGSTSFDAFGSPLGEPFFVDGVPAKARARLVRGCLDALDQLARASSAGEVLVRLLPARDAALSDFARRLSQAQPAVGCMFEMIADLSVDERTRWQSVRSSYHSEIRRMQERATMEVRDKPGDGGLETLQLLHRRVAGVTRGDGTWQLQRAAIDAGQAFVVTVAVEGAAVGASLIHRTDTHAVYAVGAYDRDLMSAGFELGHISLWTAMSYLADATRVTSYTIGWRIPPNESRTPKEVGIDQFKEGFASAILARPLIAYRSR